MKGFFPVHSSCHEFGHIHQVSIQSGWTELSYSESSAEGSGESDCHEGKIFGSSIVLNTMNLKNIIVSSAYGCVFEIANFFISPYLEPNKKPPRVA
ncbi:MAG: hypothetical protein JNL11_19990 [Bdellovibrionaceae bacterium]|nr:hypothetical protein [Pseudobdellovibrionaceae bacterium]